MWTRQKVCVGEGRNSGQQNCREQSRCAAAGCGALWVGGFSGGEFVEQSGIAGVAISDGRFPNDHEMRFRKSNFACWLTLIALVGVSGRIRCFSQTTNGAASTNAIQAEMDAAIHQVEKIVNQPVTAY